MNDEIKSALEIALEKAAKVGEATQEERLRWKYMPEGEQLATKCLKDDCNLVAEISQFPENVRKYVAEGAAGVFIRNITLPKNDHLKRINRKAMDGLKAVKKDKAKVENTFSRIRYVFNHYAEQGEQQRKQTYESLKADFEARIQQAMRQQQMGPAFGGKIDVERQPQFQQEWRKVLSQLDAQYQKLLDEYKHELTQIH